MNTGSRSDSAYKHVVLEKCYGALEAVGFTRYRKGGVDWPLGSNFHCWVGLNAGLRPESVCRRSRRFDRKALDQQENW